MILNKVGLVLNFKQVYEYSKKESEIVKIESDDGNVEDVLLILSCLPFFI
jgi:hypothetical protein